MDNITDNDKDISEKPIRKKPSKSVKVKEVHLSLDQYFTQHRPDIHEYTRAYVGSSYRGIIKTAKEWDDELKSKL